MKRRVWIAALLAVVAGCGTSAAPATPTPYVVPYVAPTVVPTPSGAASYIAFRSHLFGVTRPFGAAEAKVEADLKAGKRSAARVDGAKLAKLVNIELTWLAGHPQVMCYSAVWIEWQFGMYATQRATTALAKGDLSVFRAEIADGSDVLGAVAEDLTYAGTNCGV